MSELEKKSLRWLIREALMASPYPDPDSVVEGIVENIAIEDFPRYLREAVRVMMSGEISTLRSSTTRGVRRGLSTKASLIRDEYWPNFLRQRIFLPTGYKHLGDATSDDLRVVAAQRKSQAEELLFRADQFEVLADLMDRSKVKRLEQLDKSAGLEILERAA